ncbi:MAG: hypothetical protein WC045_01935 [Patescibacteria group bacterium]
MPRTPTTPPARRASSNRPRKVDYRLRNAIAENNIVAVRAAIKAGADPNRRMDLDFQTPTHTAASLDLRDIMICLIANGADPYQQDKSEFTPYQLGNNKTKQVIYDYYGQCETPPIPPGAPLALTGS